MISPIYLPKSLPTCIDSFADRKTKRNQKLFNFRTYNLLGPKCFACLEVGYTPRSLPRWPLVRGKFAIGWLLISYSGSRSASGWVMEEFINRAELLCSLDPPVLATSSLNNWIHDASTYKRAESRLWACRTCRARLNPRRRIRWISCRICPWLITGGLGIAVISWAIAVNAFALSGKFCSAIAGSGLGGSGLAIWCPDKIIRIGTVLRTRSVVLYWELRQAELLYGELRQTQKFRIAVCQECSFDICLS